MSTISAGTSVSTALVNTGDTTGQLVLKTNNGTTAVTIGTDQVVTLAQPLPVASGGTGSASGVNLATGVSGTLPVGNGGTGQTSLTSNNVILGNGGSAVQFVAPGSSGNILTSNGTTWTSAAPAASGAKTWTAFTSSGTYTVPAGVTSIRAYAFGKGEDGNVATFGGGGGGCAYGDIAVTPGQTVTIGISSGIATVTYAATTMLTANPGSGTTGGTASKDVAVTNGGNYSGGSGSDGGGGSSGSPLGNGQSGSGGGGGWGGSGGGNTTYGGGGGGGVGGSGGTGSGSFNPGAGGGAGGSAIGNKSGRARDPIIQTWSDPLLHALECYGPGGIGNGTDSRSTNPAQSGVNGGGGGGGGPGHLKSSVGTAYGGDGGAGGGGGGSVANASGGFAYGGNGGFGGGGGQGTGSSYGAGGNGGYGGGGGRGAGGGGPGGTGGSAIVLIYA